MSLRRVAIRRHSDHNVAETAEEALFVDEGCCGGKVAPPKNRGGIRGVLWRLKLFEVFDLFEKLKHFKHLIVFSRSRSRLGSRYQRIA